MDARIRPGGVVSGATRVPGDKSIAHRWILFASIADGPSGLRGLPRALDVASSAQVFGTLGEHPELLEWARQTQLQSQDHGSTWIQEVPSDAEVRVEGRGLAGLRRDPDALDCGNSGTTMRLALGLVAGLGGTYELRGDDSLSSRPMERVAEPLREMGASITTTDGHAPLFVGAAALHRITYELPVASAQVKSALLLAGAQADGETVIVDPHGTRDHTERALEALGARVRREGAEIHVERSPIRGFEGVVPSDPSSAAFVVAAAAITGGEVSLHDVGLNPSRIAFADVMTRMGVRVTTEEKSMEVGEHWGSVTAAAPEEGLLSITMTPDESARCIDEIPVLAALAVHASGESRFEGLAELRHKESDRLAGLAEGLAVFGADTQIDGDALIIRGGAALGGGRMDPHGDHRMAMAFAVAALGAQRDSVVEDIGCAAVSFPGFAATLVALGAGLEPA